MKSRAWTPVVLKFSFILRLLPLLMSGCTQDSVFSHREKVTVRSVAEFSQDILIPIQLWDLVEGKAIDPTTGIASPAEGAVTPGNSGNIIFAPLRVLLFEKNEGVLKSPKMQIDYPLGGGQLDLSEVTTGKIGTFFFGIEIPEISGLIQTRVFYVSGARKRKLDGDVFGSGCQLFMDISEKFQHEMKKEGIKVNTSRNRHVSVLAGNFILTAHKDNQILVSQLTVIDSKNSHLLCRNPKETKNESDPPYERE